MNFSDLPKMLREDFTKALVKELEAKSKDKDPKMVEAELQEFIKRDVVVKAIELLESYKRNLRVDDPMTKDLLDKIAATRVRLELFPREWKVVNTANGLAVRMTPEGHLLSQQLEHGATGIPRVEHQTRANHQFLEILSRNP